MRRRSWRTAKSTSRRSVTRWCSTVCEADLKVGTTSGGRRHYVRRTMKRWVVAAAIALAASSGVPHAQTDTLSDLDAMTFSCPKAALNEAAREAAKVRSQGTY